MRPPRARLPDRVALYLRAAYFWVLGRLYGGTALYCPCCERSYRAFLPFGRNRRPAAQCPGCGSLERHRLLALFLRNRTNVFRDSLAVLHMAPEASVRRMLRSSGNLVYTSADLSSPLADVKADITHLPFKDGQFDVVLCMHVLEHIPDDLAAMRELYRVMKPRGWGIIQPPVNPEQERTIEDSTVVSPQERERLYGQHDHMRSYGRDYSQRLESAGFSVESVSYLSELPQSVVVRSALWTDHDEMLYVCSK